MKRRKLYTVNAEHIAVSGRSGGAFKAFADFVRPGSQLSPPGVALPSSSPNNVSEKEEEMRRKGEFHQCINWLATERRNGVTFINFRPITSLFSGCIVSAG